MPDEKNAKPEQSITTPKSPEAKASPLKVNGDKTPGNPKVPTPAEKSNKPTAPPKVSKSQKPKELPKSTEKPKPPGKPTPKPQATTKATQKSKVPPELAKSEEKAPPTKPAPTLRKGEKIVNLKLSDLRPFKNHPFSVKDDAEMLAMVESVRDKGVTQPAIVRPREDGGYEIVSGHRRQRASELAGLAAVPCIVRNLTDEEATLQMVEDNLNQRDYILPSERAKALKMQFEAIKKQGVKGDGRRSDEVVGERNGMSGKQVQRYIKLNDLCPELLKLVDEKKIAFSPAVHLAFIKTTNQVYIADTIESLQASPNLSQAKRMHELDEQNMLKPDVIDGIMLEEKKEVDNVIISSKELEEFFPKTATPRDMKEQIMTLLQDWSKTKPKEQAKPAKDSDAR